MSKKVKENGEVVNSDFKEQLIEEERIREDTTYINYEHITASEAFSPKNLTEGFKGETIFDFLILLSDSFKKLFEKIKELQSKNPTQIAIDPVESEEIEEPDLTDVASEEKNMEYIIETNRFLAIRYDKLSRKYVELSENYETLVKESNEKITALERRIKELIDSKTSVSKTPSFWIEEAFSVTLEKDNVD